MGLAMFTKQDDLLIPTDIARSMWSDNQMHGVAVSGALARGLEAALRDLGREDLQPARYAVDLFKPAAMRPCEIRTRVVREGRRICLLDAELVQDDVVVARASGTFLSRGDTPTGLVWQPTDHAAPPPEDEVPASEEPRVPFFSSGQGWSQSFKDHQNAARKRTWQTGLPVVDGELPSGFVTVAGVADSASMLLNWGTEGVQYINADISLTLARAPYGLEVGLSSTDRVASEGISVGSAEVFDRLGPLGTVTIVALANAERPVDFENVEYADDGTRRRTNG